MKYNNFFARHPVFTLEEFDDYLASSSSFNPKNRNAILAYYRKQGRLIAVRRGLHAVIPLGMTPDSAPVDPFLLAGKMTNDAVLAYHTALEFHGSAYSATNRFVYLSEKQSVPLHFRGYEFRCTPAPKALIDKAQESFGVETAERMGVSLHVTSLERTLVDILDRPNLGGSWEEIWRSLELVEYFNLDTVVEYALLLKNATTAAKVGFFLEQHRDALMVEEKHLQSLKKEQPVQPHYLDRKNRKNGVLVKNWNIMVPKEIIHQVWDEII
ncbi:Transcriptional regulator, predicted component of viral defense system [Desulfatibacillum alkenivorans DSM 16219]|jgi:predicted transcriptional regulator of viral defense system|uniref:Transcriptional regulator, predicted component of viral defense system n=1 Tax=Desulfatibacillum alkenivorans DSM 16219 TaxID=1121393 RepID=A0A1M6PHG3_9BACT|nr:Transcriptional regulator, predicted component of viral defense system [Desulfatibacillum alkenivorans DSM 16219]